mmetsp:Transcript_40709/g.105685  ORF Transcript_40709/g.105685 Transcript_40709/m.105685 type:complete len:159 (-) Transcript_40709:24-500(-)
MPSPEELIGQELDNAKNTQDSVQTISTYIQIQKKWKEVAARVWKDKFASADVQKKLVLVYIANDVLQHSKRKTGDFIAPFESALEDVVRCFSDFTSSPDVRKRVGRVLSIWKERNVIRVDVIEALQRAADGDESATVASTSASAAAPAPPRRTRARAV